MQQKNKKTRGLLTVLTTSLITLIALSLLPWNNLTNNYLKDFNLIGDIITQSDKVYITYEELDPALSEIESVLAEEKKATSDSCQPESTPTESNLTSLPYDYEAPTSDGVVLIEDFSGGRSGLAKIRQGLINAESKTYRIAVLGDSYIEGDILTQDIRAILQEQYGGKGVGYIAAYSHVYGFRQSIIHTANGWTQKEIRDMRSDDYRILSGQYYIGQEGSTTTYKGNKKSPNTSQWTKSTLLFIAPDSGNITVKESEDYTNVYNVSPSEEVQSIVINRPTTKFSYTSGINNLIVLGTWLETENGVQVDNMSLRGNSGICHRTLNNKVISEMRNYIDYDLIILEFGMNALTSEQKDYSSYQLVTQRVINSVKAAYPSSTIMLMGIGDRGQKQGSEVGSINTAPAMVRAQREAAQATGILFWDTRKAMGGDNAVVDWHKRGLVNSDYIHLNHKGGRELASLFVQSLNISISE